MPQSHVHLVLNPDSHQAERVQARVRALEPDVIVLTTTKDDPGTGQARRAVAEGSDLVLVAGGDGTVRAVAQGLRGTGVPMAILPMGTANIFARNLGLRPRQLTRHLQVALGDEGTVRPLDLGVARWQVADDGPHHWSEEHLFLVMAGIGHDADTVLDTSSDIKRRFGWFAYLGAGVRHLASPAVPMQVAFDHGRPTTRVLWSLLAGNAPRIPGGVEVFPSALLDDGQLLATLCSVQRPDQWLAVGLKGLFHVRRDIAHLTHHRAAVIDVEPARPLPVQLDGDVFGPVTRLELRVDHRALHVVVPRSSRMTRKAHPRHGHTCPDHPAPDQQG